MEANILQIILLCIYVVIQAYDMMNTQVLIYGYVVSAGFFTGLIFGDIQTGLMIGGTLQLMTLGVGAYGGASIPDYTMGAIIGTAVAVLTGKGMDAGLAVAVPVALLMMQLDILVRTACVWFVHKAEACVDKGEYNKMAVWIRAGFIPWALKSIIPVLLVLTVGSSLVQTVVDVIPNWLMKGISTAGGVLPAVGIAILLRYMNTKNYFAYLLVGFALYGYLKVPMLGVAIFGIAAGIITYKNAQKVKNLVPAGVMGNVGGAADDEL